MVAVQLVNSCDLCIDEQLLNEGENITEGVKRVISECGWLLCEGDSIRIKDIWVED